MTLAVQRQVLLTGFNTLALPAVAEAYCRIERDEQLAEALTLARNEGWTPLILGGGSNCVFSQNVPGLVLHLAQRGIHASEHDGELVVEVAAGENWDALVRYSLEQGWYGLENLIAIPGAAAAAPVQNIGAYGLELSSRLLWVEGWDIDAATLRRLSLAECQLAYRDSIFKHALRDRFVICRLALRLSRRPETRADYPALRDFLQEQGQNPDALHPQTLARAVAEIRASKLPDYRREPNAGSFFKNPILSAGQAEALLQEYPGMPHWPMTDGRVKLAAAWLVDQCGWKGRREGKVGVHPQQAIVLVNYNHANGEELLALAARIQDSVYARFAVLLDIEPRVY